MEINYSLSVKDILVGNIYLFSKIKSYRMMALFVLLITLLGGISITSHSSMDIGVRIISIIIMSIVLQLLIYILLLVFYFLYLSIHSDARKLLSNNIQISIDKKQLCEATAIGTQISTWEQIKGVYEVDRYILIYINDMNICIIPVRSFNSELESHSFAVFAKKSLYNSRNPNDQIE
jgi:hypothetical protein